MKKKTTNRQVERNHPVITDKSMIPVYIRTTDKTKAYCPSSFVLSEL